MSFHLANAEQVAREAKNGEFQLPSKEKRDNLKIGDWAYIVFTVDDEENDERPGERFWVQILRRQHEHGPYVGLLKVKLVHYDVAPESEITFEPHNIYNTLTAEEMDRSDRIYRVMGPYAAYLYQTEGHRAVDDATNDEDLDRKLEEWERGKRGTTIYSRPSLTNRVHKL